VNWNDARAFCDWLSAKTGKEWRLPTSAEWEAAVGNMKYPWGDYYPPNWDDGNYAVGADGKDDPKKIGVDGILGTAPVGSFHPNVLGFYDLGGNVGEWMWDGLDEKKGTRLIRGADCYNSGETCAVSRRLHFPMARVFNVGFRLARSSSL
jgi:formylglycine-generating enzyme required for sulfatase activity